MGKKIFANFNPNFIVFLQNQQRIAVVCGNNIHVYNYETGDLIQILNSHSAEIKLLSIYEQKSILSLDSQGQLYIWDIDNFSVQIQKDLQRKVAKACLSKNIEYLYLASSPSNNIIKFEMATMELENPVFEEIPFKGKKAKAGSKFGLSITDNGKFLVDFNGKTITIYDSDTRMMVNKFQHICEIVSLELQNTNEYIIIGDVVGKITFYYHPYIKGNVLYFLIS